MKTFTISLLLAIATIPASMADRIEEHRCAVPHEGAIIIENASGSVVVKTWDESEVLVRGQLQANVRELTVVCTEREVRISAVRPGFSKRNADANLEILVPESKRGSLASLAVTTVSANIRVEQAFGAVTLRTVSGDMKIDGAMESLRATCISGTIRVSGSADEASFETVSGDIQIKANVASVEAGSISGTIRIEGDTDEADLSATSGDIMVEGRAGTVRANAVSGTVRIENVHTSVESGTMSGDILVTGHELMGAELGAVSGTIRFSGSLHPEARFSAETKSGDILLTLPEQTPLRARAQSRSGDILCKFPGAAPRQQDPGPGQMLEYATGAATCTLNLSSTSGTIRIAPN